MAERQPTSIPETQRTSHEGGNGALGLPRTVHESANPPPESQELHPLPSVSDILERRAQLIESFAGGSTTRQRHSFNERRRLSYEYEEQQNQLAAELYVLYDEGTDRDRLILDIYRTLTKSSPDELGDLTEYLSAKKTRAFIARVAPMSEGELGEELRSAKEAVARKASASSKAQETKARRYRNKISPSQVRENQKQLERENKARLRKMLR